MNYFTSDPHYHHTNIIKYCDRPFSSTEEHDKELIKRWNSIVKKDDMAFILGDLIFTKDPQEAVEILLQLNGIISIVPGNHDYSRVLKVISKHVNVLSGLVDLQVKDEEIDGGIQRITLCHYPMISWNQSHRGAWQLFGHHHNGNEKGGAVYSKLTANQLEVGVDAHDFYPISYERVKELITKQNLKV